MIGTIGSLVQETLNRWRWLASASLYTVACAGTATLFGAALGGFGHIVRSVLCGVVDCSAVPFLAAWLVGLLAIAYAMSDIGLILLPRPTLMYAVPLAWWRLWRPYGAALVYGAALGLGVTTAIAFGSFYVICVVSILKGDVAYGSLLLGTYGAARALVIFPASRILYTCRTATKDSLSRVLASLPHAQGIVAVSLVALGIQYLLTATL